MGNLKRSLHKLVKSDTDTSKDTDIAGIGNSLPVTDSYISNYTYSFFRKKIITLSNQTLVYQAIMTSIYNI